MNTSITKERDAKNCRIIQHSFRQALGCNMSAQQMWLLDCGTPEERDAYVKKQLKHFMIGSAAVIGCLAIFSMIPRDPVPPPPVPEITTAGQVQSLRLHETALSTSTTVITAMGTYQVRGGVSATTGDAVTLKRHTDGLHRTSLCVESKIKTACYTLL